MNKLGIALAFLLVIGSLSAVYTISGTQYTNKIPINCTLVDTTNPIVVNGSGGFQINSTTQIVWTQCQSNLSVYYNTMFDYVIGTNTTKQNFKVELGNGTSNNPASVWTNARALYLDGNATDTMGNYDLTTMQAGAIVPGKVGNCFNFTLNTQSAQIASNLGIGSGSITMSTWIYSYTLVGATNSAFMFKGDATSHDEYYFGQHQYSTPANKLFAERLLQNTLDVRATSTLAMPQNTWIKLTTTFNGATGNLSFYLNGTYVASTDATGNGASGGQTAFQINEHGDTGSWAAIVGRYDQVEVFNDTKNASYISQSYNNEQAVAGYGMLGTNESSSGGGASANLSVNAGTGGTATGNATSFTYPANKTITATASTSYTFNNWTITSAGTNCTILNASSNNTNVSITNNETCIVLANFNYTPTLACQNITIAGTTLVLNASLTSAGTCFNVSAANAMIDCNGYSITGGNVSLTYGVFTNQFNTTVKNCLITNFSNGIALYQATNGTFNNNTIVSTGTQISSGIYPNLISGGIAVQNSSYNRISNTLINATWRGIDLTLNNNWNSINNVTVKSDWDCAFTVQCTGAYNTFNNITAYGRADGTQSFGMAINTGNNNNISNFTTYNQTEPIFIEDVCGLGADRGANNNIFANGTIVSATRNLLTFTSGSGNVFYWMNFTPTSGAYVSGSASGNWFNSSTEGNFWADVLSGSVNIVGTTPSSFASYYIGNNGTGYPYNNAHSGKVAAGTIDYHPLTPFFDNSAYRATINVLCGFGGSSCITNASNFAFPVNKSIQATALSNYTFSNWAVTAGTCTIVNTAASSTYATITANETCNVSASFIQNPSSLVVNAGTGGSAAGNNSSFTAPKTLTISASAAVNYTFNNWTVTSGTCTVTDNNTPTTVTIPIVEACIIQANFLYTPAAYNFGNLIVLCGANGASCLGNASNFVVPATKTVSATPNYNYTFLSWTLAGNCTATSSVLILVNNGTCTATANFILITPTPPSQVNVNYLNYSSPNITGVGGGFDYSASVMTTATGNSDAFGLMVLSTIWICFYIVGSRYTQERALVFSTFMTVIVAFLMVSGNFLSPNWLILLIVALLASIYFAGRIG